MNRKKLILSALLNLEQQKIYSAKMKIIKMGAMKNKASGDQTSLGQRLNLGYVEPINHISNKFSPHKAKYTLSDKLFIY